MRILIIAALLLANSALQAADNDKDRSPKLKFKNGPVCMCARGLSEKDIIKQGGHKQQVLDKNSSAKQSQQLDASQKRDSEEK
jgi:hypothetical protein